MLQAAGNIEELRDVLAIAELYTDKPVSIGKRLGRGFSGMMKVQAIVSYLHMPAHACTCLHRRSSSALSSFH